MRLYKPPPCRAERQIKKLQFADINTFVDLLYLLFLSRQTEILQIRMDYIVFNEWDHVFRVFKTSFKMISAH